MYMVTIGEARSRTNALHHQSPDEEISVVSAPAVRRKLVRYASRAPEWRREEEINTAQEDNSNNNNNNTTPQPQQFQPTPALSPLPHLEEV